MIRPLLSGQALVDTTLGFDAGTYHFALWWLGQSGFLFKWRGDYLLIDPYLSDSLTQKYAGTDKPPRRARFAWRLGMDMAIPHHFAMFAFNTADPAEFARTCRELSVPHRVLQCGESWCPIVA